MINCLKGLFLFVLFATFTQEATARCGKSSADQVLNSRFSCPSGTFTEAVHALPSYYKKIVDICDQGCNLSSLNPANDEQCSKLYAQALAGFSQIPAIAQKNNCKDSGSYAKPKGEPKVGTPESSCRWLSQQQVKLSCAGGCTAKGDTLCAGEVLCSTPFDFSGQKVPAGAYSVSCLTGASCDKVPLEECFSDQMTTSQQPVYDPSVRPNIQRARSVN